WHVAVAGLIDRPASGVRNTDLVLLHHGPVGHVPVLAHVLFVDRPADGVRLLHFVRLGHGPADGVALLAVTGLVDRPAGCVALLLHDRLVDGSIADLRVRFGNRLIANAMPDRRHAALVGADDSGRRIRADAAERGPRLRAREQANQEPNRPDPDPFHGAPSGADCQGAVLARFLRTGEYACAPVRGVGSEP